MQSLRGSIASLPNTLSNLISNTNIATSPVDGQNLIASLPTSPSIERDASVVSGDDGSDKSHAIPSSLIKEQWQLILDQDATINDLSNAIEKCKELVLSTDECSDERKWIVRHLVELRFRLREMEDANIDQPKTTSAYKVNYLLSIVWWLSLLELIIYSALSLSLT